MQKREIVIPFLKALREEIMQGFEALEPKETFRRSTWTHTGGGGGEMSVLRGETFEKAAVNWSAVEGKSFPMDDGKGPFFATGVSLITHMTNPHAPTVHMNIRYIETKDSFWLAGGYDLTPMGFCYEEDKEHFHQIAKNTLGDSLYQDFSKQAKEYFFIPHRNKERGVGGIFFDHYNTGSWEQDLQLWKSIGSSFLSAIIPLYQRRISMPFSLEDKEKQLKARAHYAEFNLLYDRGTKFGFLSGGNPEAILCSMPPLVRW
jgi:coproporphyrinogen III oxidase